MVLPIALGDLFSSIGVVLPGVVVLLLTPLLGRKLK